MARRSTAAPVVETAAASSSEATSDPKGAGRFSIAKAWSPTLARTRHVAIVRGFLHEYSTLKPHPLTSGEALFVIHLMDFKWGEEAPWPSYRTLARRMGVSVKMVRRHGQSLATKGYLFREVRRADTNRFHLNGLFRALEKQLAERPRKRRREEDDATP